MMGSETVTLCADDFGLSRAIDTGIIALAKRKRITGTSVMVTPPGWQRSLEALREHKEHLDIGLHFDLTEGEATTSSPLWPQQKFPSLWRWIGRRLATTSTRNIVALELNRQLDRFEAAFGQRPDHIDGHQHVHVLPAVADSLIAVVAERYGTEGPWVRLPTDHPLAIMQRPEPAKAAFVSGLAARLDAALRRSGLAHNKGFSGFSAFKPGSSFQAAFPRMLTQLGPLPLVMCHPASGPGATSREAEHAYFSSESFAALLVEKQLRLIRMSIALRKHTNP